MSLVLRLCQKTQKQWFCFVFSRNDMGRPANTFMTTS